VLSITLHKHELYLLEQHRKSFKFGWYLLGLTLRGKSLIMKLGPGV